MWDEIWERTRGLEVAGCPVLAHSVTFPPENQEAGQLAQVWYMEESRGPQEVACGYLERLTTRGYTPFERSLNKWAYYESVPGVCPCWVSRMQETVGR